MFTLRYISLGISDELALTNSVTMLEVGEAVLVITGSQDHRIIPGRPYLTYFTP